MLFAPGPGGSLQCAWSTARTAPPGTPSHHQCLSQGAPKPGACLANAHNSICAHHPLVCESFAISTLARFLDLSAPKDRALLEKFAKAHKPRDLWTVPFPWPSAQFHCPRCSMKTIPPPPSPARHLLSRTSPDCTCFTYLQRINKARHHDDWRPAGEKVALDTLKWCRRLHRQQLARGGRSHHEQSAMW